MHKPLTKTQIAIVNGQSVFQYKVKSVSDGMAKSERAIKPSTNEKLGKIVKKGRLRGAKIYTLTLEERKTCPKSCFHWKDCFGNNMHLAVRYVFDKALLEQIERDIEFYNDKGKAFLVRLHILGDFPSVEYVNFWNDLLDKYEHLNVYGYSAHQLETPIGEALDDMRDVWDLRFMVRISGDTKTDNMTALSYDDEPARKQIETKKAFVCPTQITHKGSTKLASKTEETLTKNCGTCGLCWTTKLNPIFLTH